MNVTDGFVALLSSLGSPGLRPWIAIACAAAVTYSLRLGGLLLAGGLPDTGRFRRFMDALPGAILLSLVVPGMMSAGPVGCLAAGVTALLARRTGNLLVAIIVGTAMVAAARQLSLPGWLL